MIYQHSSIWQTTDSLADQLRAPAGLGPLCEHLEADIVIVGAGISGLTAAHLLAGTGKKIIVLEAYKVGMGTSGRSTGNLYSLIDQQLHKLIDTWGEDNAKMVIASREMAIKQIESLINSLGIECNFQRVKFTYYSEEENQMVLKFLEKETAAAQKIGLYFKRQTKINALPFLTKQALEFPNQAQFNPLKYLKQLSAALPENVQIYESTPVTEIDYKDKIVRCHGGSVKASKIIVATNIPKGISPAQYKLIPIREYGLAAELREGDFPGVYWSIQKDRKSVRSLAHQDKNYVMVIGKKFKTGHQENYTNELDELNEYLLHRFFMTDARFWWSAQSYQSADMLPLMGEFRKDCYAMTGFSTDGLVYGTLGAMIISDLIQQRSNEYADLYSFKRYSLLKSLGPALKNGLDNFCQYLKDIPGVKTLKLDSLEAGEGGIVESQGEKLAVYKDENGTHHCISAVCSHMKCIVTFNAKEKSWDCPCHASRFNLQGKVLEGPALKDLEEKKL